MGSVNFLILTPFQKVTFKFQMRVNLPIFYFSRPQYVLRGLGWGKNVVASVEGDKDSISDVQNMRIASRAIILILASVTLIEGPFSISLFPHYFSGLLLGNNNLHG